MTPLVSDADFIAAIRGALPPPPAMTPPPPFLVRPTPPPRYVPTVEEPQPESVASRALTEIAHYTDDRRRSASV